MDSPSQLQRDFLATVADPFQVRLLFEHLPGILFFLKDRDSRLMAASRGVLSRMARIRRGALRGHAGELRASSARLDGSAGRRQGLSAPPAAR